MLRLQARAQVLLPAVIECISRRHSGVAQQLRYVGQFHRCQGTSTKSAATRAADTEYKPIKKLLVANRGNRCSHLFVVTLMLHISIVTCESTDALGHFTFWISPSLSGITERNHCNSQASRSNYRG